MIKTIAIISWNYCEIFKKPGNQINDIKTNDSVRVREKISDVIIKSPKYMHRKFKWIKIISIHTKYLKENNNLSKFIYVNNK